MRAILYYFIYFCLIISAGNVYNYLNSCLLIVCYAIACALFLSELKSSLKIK